MSDAPIEEMSFEAAMAELEKVLGQLERGDVALDESIALYERGAALKARCEAEARKAFGDDHTCVVRPGLIVGPGDTTDRFTYWPVRSDRGGEVLAPGDGTDPIQIIDVRDLADGVRRLLRPMVDLRGLPPRAAGRRRRGGLPPRRRCRWSRAVG